MIGHVGSPVDTVKKPPPYCTGAMQSDDWRRVTLYHDHDAPHATDTHANNTSIVSDTLVVMIGDKE